MSIPKPFIPHKISSKDSHDRFPEHTSVETMTIREFYNDIALSGIYYDKRYDARIRWEVKRMVKYADSILRNFALDPLWIGDVQSSYNQAALINDVKNMNYFSDVLMKHNSMTPPIWYNNPNFDPTKGVNQFTGPRAPFWVDNFPLIKGCKYITADGKNRDLLYILLYLYDPDTYGDMEVNVGRIKGATRSALSSWYKAKNQQANPNRMMVRLGGYSGTGDLIHNYREELFNLSVIREGYPEDKKTPKIMDGMTLFFSDKKIAYHACDKALCSMLKVVTDGLDSFNESFDDRIDELYDLPSLVKPANKKDLKTMVKMLQTFITKYFHHKNTQKYGKNKVSQTSWKLNIQSFYLLLTLFLILIKEQTSFEKTKWKEIIDKIYNWIDVMNDATVDEWNYSYKEGKNKGEVKGFSSIMSDWSSNKEARQVIKELIEDTLYDELFEDGCVTGYKRVQFSVKQHKKMMRNDKGWVRIQGSKKGIEFKDTPKGKEALRELAKEYDFEEGDEYIKITLDESLKCEKWHRDHITPLHNPNGDNGEHSVKNGEIVLRAYNEWKSDDEPDYTYETRNIPIKKKK